MTHLNRQKINRVDYLTLPAGRKMFNKEMRARRIEYERSIAPSIELEHRNGRPKCIREPTRGICP